ncbi:binding partner of ACD11 1-like [Mercurialis annua]|uniref:binding partner of ACD11 1-like n=1 Tax=Mercurialis annua TaxID=3986 RepID=UPI0024AE3F1D|nr:binding partner of ACD11 1-like [Mercurialis annua]
MHPGGYTAEVTCLSPKATVEDVYDFFAHCGAIEHVEIMRSGDYGCTAYVTFKSAYALETAILLSGATIVDQRVCISHWGTYADESYHWNGGTTGTYIDQYATTPGEAVTVAQEVVKTMLSKGYILGKDTLIKAKSFDESYKLSAITAAKIAALSNRIGLTEKIQEGMQTVKSVDEKYHITNITASAILVTGTAAVVAATYTGKAAVAAANAVYNSTYFAKGALWVSDALTRAAQAAADFGHDKDGE